MRTGRLGLIFDPREDLAFEMAYRAVDRIERVRYDEKLRENIDAYDHLGGSYGR